MELTVHGFLFMEQICIGFAYLKSFGALAVNMHGCIAHIIFLTSDDAWHFRKMTPGAELDSELVVRVELNTFLGSLDKVTKPV